MDLAQNQPARRTVIPRLASPSRISMMSKEHREITKAAKHPEHTPCTPGAVTSLPDGHQGQASPNTVEQQLMVQRQLFGQICACLTPSWKVSSQKQHPVS